MVIVGFIAPKMVSYIRVPANRYHFKNNHYTPPTKKIVQVYRQKKTKKRLPTTPKTAWTRGIEEK
jgi:alpha-acetolactate decarboxylase